MSVQLHFFPSTKENSSTFGEQQQQKQDQQSSEIHPTSSNSNRRNTLSAGHRFFYSSGFAFKTTNPQRLNMDPPNGVLEPRQCENIAISCDVIDTATEQMNNDRVTVEWTNTPDGAAKQFRYKWLQGDIMVRRKNLPIEYNQ